MSKEKKIGSFYAKTNLSSLLHDVQMGTEYTITNRGKPVAKITPYVNEENMETEEIMKQFDSIRKSVKGKVDIKKFIEEGRKY
ncbi:MAG: type II toxin-antitoxin system prevent-host-death family antitoxin [Leptospirales bacterium]